MPLTTLKDGDTAVGYYVGFDTAVNEENPIYFRLLHSVVRGLMQSLSHEDAAERSPFKP